MAKVNGGIIIITLQSTESAHTYSTTKNKRNNAGRMEIRKYDPLYKKHTIYKEKK